MTKTIIWISYFLIVTLCYVLSDVRDTQKEILSQLNTIQLQTSTRYTAVVENKVPMIQIKEKEIK